MSEVSEYEIDVYRRVEEYILDLSRSSSAYDKSRAHTLQNNLYNIPHECREGFIKLVDSGWDFIAVDYLNSALLGDIRLAFMNKATSSAVLLDQEGRIVGTFKIIPHVTDIQDKKDWKAVNMSVDEYISYANQMGKVDQADRQALENL